MTSKHVARKPVIVIGSDQYTEERLRKIQPHRIDWQFIQKVKDVQEPETKTAALLIVRSTLGSAIKTAVTIKKIERIKNIDSIAVAAVGNDEKAVANPSVLQASTGAHVISLRVSDSLLAKDILAL